MQTCAFCKRTLVTEEKGKYTLCEDCNAKAIGAIVFCERCQIPMKIIRSKVDYNVWKCPQCGKQVGR